MENNLKKIENNINSNNKDCLIDTGVKGLNDYLPNLSGSLLSVIASKTSVGKTSLSINLFYNICCQLKQDAEQKNTDQKKAIFISTEMSQESLTTKMISFITGIPFGNLCKNNYTNYEPSQLKEMTKEEIQKAEKENFSKIKQASNILSGFNASFFTPAKGDLDKIKKLIVNQNEKNEIGVVIIDCLDLIRCLDDEEISLKEVVIQLKSISKELNIPIIITAQLPRSAENLPAKTSMISNLKWGDCVESYIDILMFLDRDNQKLEQNEKSNCSVFIEKNRFGSTGEVSLTFDPEVGKFTSLHSN
jgi:replicative DNA helicase